MGKNRKANPPKVTGKKDVDAKLAKDYTQVIEPPAGFKESRGNMNLVLWGKDDSPIEVRGVFKGFVDGRVFRDKGGKERVTRDVEIESGDTILKVTCPAILEDRMSTVPVGAEVIIRHLGSIDTPNGLAHNFQVLYKPSDQEKLPF